MLDRITDKPTAHQSVENIVFFFTVCVNVSVAVMTQENIPSRFLIWKAYVGRISIMGKC